MIYKFINSILHQYILIVINQRTAHEHIVSEKFHRRARGERETIIVN